MKALADCPPPMRCPADSRAWQAYDTVAAGGAAYAGLVPVR